MIELTTDQVGRLFTYMGIVRTPQLDDPSSLVIPHVIKSKFVSKPIELLASLTNESKNVVFIILRHVHLRVVGARGCVRRHSYSL